MLFFAIGRELELKTLSPSLLYDCILNQLGLIPSFLKGLRLHFVSGNLTEMFFVIFHLPSLHVCYWMLMLETACEELLTGVDNCKSANIVEQGGKMTFRPGKVEVSAVL